MSAVVTNPGLSWLQFMKSYTCPIGWIVYSVELLLTRVSGVAIHCTHLLPNCNHRTTYTRRRVMYSFSRDYQTARHS